MDERVTKYLACIGRRGGLKSRRRLDPAVARGMVKLREARRAYRRFHAQCFWFCDPDYRVTSEDVDWVGRQLMQNGGRRGWTVGAALLR